MRLLVYSHDAYGLGNIRRMLAICEYLLSEIPELSILLLSGSPMLQGFRLPRGLDYIKLPCLNRGETGEVAVKYLGMGIDETVKLRSELILSAAMNFQPDLFLVDKKAYGLKNELTDTVNYFHKELPKTKLVLLLRDILDAPEKTIAEWSKNNYYEAIEKFYEMLLVVGTEDVFDFRQGYQLPKNAADKVRFCGYLHRQAGLKKSETIREELQVNSQQKLVLVTPGGGEDGYQLVDTYLQGLELQLNSSHIKSLIICGPEMPVAQRKKLYKMASVNKQIIMGEFTDDLMSYMVASDAVVSMGGYNTICEILSAKKPAVVVPRTVPSHEQLIRAQKMEALGLFKSVNPEILTPHTLMSEVLDALENPQNSSNIDLEGLPRLTRYIRNLLADKFPSEFLYPKLLTT